MLLPFHAERNEPRTHGCYAFTLIELIIVMALLTIAVGLTAPRLSAFFHGRTLDYEARRLLTLTRYAQDRAASDGLPVRLWLDAKSGAYGIEPDPSYQRKDASTAPSADQFTIDKALTLEITATRALPPQSRSVSKPQDATSRSQYSAFPSIVFQPDGTIDETSPERLTLKDDGGFTVMLARTPNRLGYEILAK